MAEKVEVSQEDIAFVRSLEDCPDKPLHESMFVPFFAAKIGEYRAAAFAAGRQQGLREAAEVARERAEKAVNRSVDPEQGDTEDNRQWDQAWRQGSYNALHCAANAITALMEGEGKK